MAHRRDPSSLSFGARLHSVEQAAATNAKRVSELEETAQSKQQKQEADVQRRYRMSERRHATSMLAAFDTSLEQLQSVDRSALTTAQAFLLDEQLKAKTYAMATPPAFYFDEAAVERLNNWGALQPRGMAVTFLQANGMP